MGGGVSSIFEEEGEKRGAPGVGMTEKRRIRREGVGVNINDERVPGGD